MGRVLTNNTSLSYTIETALQVAGSTWYRLDPNEISTFGAEITTVPRNPISANRQRLKGTVTDLDSSMEFGHDITLSVFRDFISGFVFANGVNADVINLTANGAASSNDTYTLASSLSSAQATRFNLNTLVWAEGFTSPANNGLKSLDTNNTGTAAIAVNESLTDEASPPSLARITFAGRRIADSDSPTWTYAAPNGTLALTGIGTALLAMGLMPGQFVHIGSIAAANSTTVVNAFQNNAANDMFGWARVKSITANAVVFDKLDAALKATDSTPPSTAVDILFGEFYRNVPTDNSAFVERSFQFEMEMPNLSQTTGQNMYQYSLGNYCNEVSFELPLADKATATFGFIGTDTANPVETSDRKTGADSASNPLDTTALSSTADIARLRVTNVDESGLSTDFKSLTLTLNNNVSAEKVLGQLGARYMNIGNFEVNVESELIFSNSAVIDRIRDNTTVTMDFVLKNDEGCIAFDFPSMTLGDGARSFPENESVLITVGGTTFQDALLNTSIGISISHVPLP